MTSKNYRSDRIELPKDEIKRLYWNEDWPKKKIADYFNVSEMTVVNRMRDYGIETKSRRQAVAKRRATYTMTSNGYMIAADAVGGKSKSMRIHQLLAIAEYGIDEVKNKEIHHKNGIPWDNRPNNIIPVTSKQHRKIHFQNTPNNER
jgi:hypothetical protein